MSAWIRCNAIVCFALILGTLTAACGAGGEPLTQATPPDEGDATVTEEGDTATELSEVVFGGSVTWFGQVPIMVAVENGFFEDEGIDLQYETILASADRINALTSGDVDFSNLGRSAVTASMAEGNEEFYYVANIDDSPGNDGLYARAGIESVEDLEGMTVAANTSAEVTLHIHLMDHDMTIDDIDYVDLPPTDMVLALRNGDVDAIDVWEPILSDAVEAVPDGTMIANDTDTSWYEKYGTAAAPDIVIMSRELVDERPEIAEATMRAVFRGVQFANENPEETAEAVAHYFQSEPEDVLEGMSTLQYFGAEDYEEHMDAHEAQWQDLAQWFYDNGRIADVPDVREWAARDFVSAIAQDFE